MTIIVCIRVHPYKATHFENRKSILHFIAFLVLHPNFITMITSIITSLFIHRKTEIGAETSLAPKHLGTAI